MSLSVNNETLEGGGWEYTAMKGINIMTTRARKYTKDIWYTRLYKKHRCQIIWQD